MTNDHPFPVVNDLQAELTRLKEECSMWNKSFHEANDERIRLKADAERWRQAFEEKNRLLAEKNETANTFMNQVKQLQARVAELERQIEDASDSALERDTLQ